MRISDWSSDVCSSDLVDLCDARVAAAQELARAANDFAGAQRLLHRLVDQRAGRARLLVVRAHVLPAHLAGARETDQRREWLVAFMGEGCGHLPRRAHAPRIAHPTPVLPFPESPPLYEQQCPT